MQRMCCQAIMNATTQFCFVGVRFNKDFSERINLTFSTHLSQKFSHNSLLLLNNMVAFTEVGVFYIL